MKIKKIKKDYLLVFSVLLALLLITVFSNFNNWNRLRGLLYPTTTTNEIEGNKQNRLEVHAFLNDHQINKEYEFSTSEDLNYRISQIDNSITTPENIDGNGTTPYVIESNKDIENIILRAPGGNFVGWSGCDAVTNNRCQVSATNHQKRKVEAHYSNPEPKTNSLQLFSVSNNPIGGSLSENWVNANPDLAYKAAYIKLTGSIPDTLGNLNPALQLNLGGNDLTGSIPDTIGNLSDTDYVGLYKNNLSGSIPDTIGDLNPIYLLAYDNNLSGSIPDTIGDMGNQVERLELHNNNLSGQIPASLGEEISSLTPNEMRFYNNNLSSAETGLMSNSTWDGVNFNGNDFEVDASMSVLEDASSRNGDYIDFCNNPTDGGTIYYNLEGEMTEADIRDEVNAALEAGWDIYIPIELRQKYRAWSVHRGGLPCTGFGLCLSGFFGCFKVAECDPPISTGYDEPPAGSVDCARLTDPIRSTDDVEPNSVGIPPFLRHVYHYRSCRWWTGPGMNCKPVCDYDLRCGSPSGCPTLFWNCYQTGWEYVDEPQENMTVTDAPFRGTCSKVHRTY